MAAWLGAPDDGLPSVKVEGESLFLVGARRDTVAFELVGSSLGGYWATSNGLRLNLAGEDFEVVPPQNREWGDGIFVQASPGDGASAGVSEFRIPATLVVPALDGPETQDLTAILRGDLSYPVPTGERTFRDVARSVQVPVRLHLVPSAETPKPPLIPGRTIVSFSIALAALAGLAVTLTPSFTRRRKSSRRRDYLGSLLQPGEIVLRACQAVEYQPLQPPADVEMLITTTGFRWTHLDSGPAALVPLGEITSLAVAPQSPSGEPERLLLGCRRMEGEGRGGQNTAVFSIRDHDPRDLVAVVSRYRSAGVDSTTG